MSKEIIRTFNTENNSWMGCVRKNDNGYEKWQDLRTVFIPCGYTLSDGLEPELCLQLDDKASDAWIISDSNGIRQKTEIRYHVAHALFDAAVGEGCLHITKRRHFCQHKDRWWLVDEYNDNHYNATSPYCLARIILSNKDEEFECPPWVDPDSELTEDLEWSDKEMAKCSRWS